MITRVFRGRLRPGVREDFARYLADVAVPEFLTSPGVAALEVHLPEEDGGEVLCATLWRDVDHVKSFAGDEWAEPRVAADEGSMLVAASVSHHIGRRLPGALVSPLPRYREEDLNGSRVAVAKAPGRVTVDGETFVLAPREYRLLHALLSASGDPVATHDLALQVWPEGACMTSEDVRRAIHKLRRTLGDHRRRPPLIRNRRGYGYLVDL